MKNLCLGIMLGLVFGVPLMAKATEVPCQSKGEGRWLKATVQPLHGSSQYLYQISAHGVYLTADLICNSSECVGFLNGMEAKGKLNFADSASSAVKSFSFETVSPVSLPAAQFICP